MTFRRTTARSLLAIALSVTGGAAALLGTPAPAAAQAAAPVRIAVVNPAKVFTVMDEKKALQATNDEEQKKLETEGKVKVAAIQAIKTGREQYKPGSPQYEDATKDLLAETAKYKVWAETERLKAEFNQKQQTKVLFDKIQQAIQEVAQRDGIDLVIADSSDRLPDDLEKVDVNALRQMILSKQVLFVSQKQGLDITDAVVLQLNAKFKQGGGRAPAPAQPK
ncbi:MAG TPA: OmpH family outer membrane protein [Humisphaera sp.]